MRVRSFLSWAFLISIVVHFTFGGLIRFKPIYAKEPEERTLRIVRIVVPTPPPTPRPTPPQKATPPPIVAAHPPPRAIAVRPPQTHPHGIGVAVEPAYSPPPGGDQNGDPGSHGTSTAPPIVATAAPTLAPAPIVTPTRPACAAPHVDARTTQKAEADYPSMAQAQGATGTVSVRVSLSETGAVVGADVYKSSGFPALDREAVKAARNSRYAPEVEDCEKVAGRYLFVVEFTSQ